MPPTWKNAISCFMENKNNMIAQWPTPESALPIKDR
jgi:hypothetical protein